MEDKLIEKVNYYKSQIEELHNELEMLNKKDNELLSRKEFFKKIDNTETKKRNILTKIGYTFVLLLTALMLLYSIPNQLFIMSILSLCVPMGMYTISSVLYENNYKKEFKKKYGFTSVFAETKKIDKQLEYNNADKKQLEQDILNNQIRLDEVYNIKKTYSDISKMVYAYSKQETNEDKEELQLDLVFNTKKLCKKKNS